MVRPIDMQTVLPRVQDHKQTKDTTVQRPDLDQQQTADKVKREMDAQQKRVIKLEKRDETKIREDNSRRNQNSGASAEQKKDENQEDEQTKEENMKQYDRKKVMKSLEYHRFDMKV